MGQQQLLLVILVTIIVGIATVVAINIFGTAADQANRDAVRQDLMAAAVQAQAIWSRPTLMDGADRDFQGTGVTNGWILARLNIPSTSYDVSAEENELSNENGTYVVNATDSDELTITGTPSSGGEPIQVTVSRNETTGNWEVTMDGLEEEETTTT